MAETTIRSPYSIILYRNKNNLSRLSVNYIGYFYYVFPLHLNTYNRLFTDVIHPKLLKLISSVTEFICLEKDIKSFKVILDNVSSYLDKFNPADKLLELIKSFSGDSYVEGVKGHINGMIDELKNKIEYDEIIQHLYSLARTYNRNLEMAYKNFKSKIDEQKTYLEENIKQYIQKINESLTSHRSCVDKLISKINHIQSQITKFEENNSKIGQSWNYTGPKKLMKPSQPNSDNQGVTPDDFRKISKSMLGYRRASGTFNIHKSILSINMKQLRFYLDQLFGKKLESDLSTSGSNNIDDILHSLEGLERKYLDNFDIYMSYIGKLAEIGGYITAMKSTLHKVKDHVKPDAARYINGLKPITIDYSQVESDVKTIKEVNKSVIGKLQIAKSSIDFYNSLKEEIEKLEGVKFNDYDFTLYLTVKQKVTSFDKAIKEKHSNAQQEIQKFKEQIEEYTKNGVKCGVEKLGEQDDSNIISKIQNCIESSLKDVPNMLCFITNYLDDIEVIEYILEVLQDINKRSPEISSIKSKVNEITKLEGATTKLTEAMEQLRKFVKVQEDTNSLISIFSSHQKFTTLSKYSKPVQGIINYSKMVIGLINYYNGFLKTVGHTDFLIKSIKTYYESGFETIKKIIENFKLYVREITSRVETINSNLLRLKWLQCGISVESNLWEFKDYMNRVKPYLTNIREKLDVISTFIDKIKQESYKIDTYKSDIHLLVTFVECYICYIKQNNGNGLKEKVVKRLGEIKDRLKVTITIIKYIIDFHKNPKCINTIESRLNSVESSVSELEYAIDGVAKNFIRCSLQSNIINTKHRELSDNNINNNGKVKIK